MYLLHFQDSFQILLSLNNYMHLAYIEQNLLNVRWKIKLSAQYFRENRKAYINTNALRKSVFTLSSFNEGTDPNCNVMCSFPYVLWNQIFSMISVYQIMFLNCIIVRIGFRISKCNQCSYLSRYSKSVQSSEWIFSFFHLTSCTLKLLRVKK